uniref:Uncharacterized protein n=1 Tax=uncultured marine virus TaxID=186617 RepID=A0A0F7L7B7_9VIRU|nr:hypothetical protein [uncultured marine virus]
MKTPAAHFADPVRNARSVWSHGFPLSPSVISCAAFSSCQASRAMISAPPGLIAASRARLVHAALASFSSLAEPPAVSTGSGASRVRSTS